MAAKLTKKERERHLAESLCRSGALRGYRVDPADRERPDVLITNGAHVIGAELAWLTDQEQTQSDSVGGRLEVLLHEKRLARIEANPASVLGRVTLFAVPLEPEKQELYWPKRAGHDAFCEALLDLVEKKATGAAKQTITVDATETPPLGMLRGLEIALNPTISRFMQWELWPRTRFVGTSQALLDALVTKKKALALTYDRTGMNELWLAIIAGPWEVAPSEEFQANLEHATGGSPAPFDRIIIAAELGQADPIVASVPERS